MPELPEVETIRRDLGKVLPGHRIQSIVVGDRRLLSVQEEKRWTHALPGQVVAGLERQGKYLLMKLQNQSRIAFHLRMTGQLVLKNSPSPKPSRLLIRFEKDLHLYFYDQRRFGEAWLLQSQDPLPTREPLGPDALNELTQEHFLQIVRGRTTRIHPLLLDQRRLAGVGNIYAQEALFKAGVRPSRPSCRLTSREASQLYDSLQETLEAAIQHRGSTSRNYLDAFGAQGSAQNLHAVYQRDGQPCASCGKVLKRVLLGGRGAVYCPQCQH